MPRVNVSRLWNGSRRSWSPNQENDMSQENGGVVARTTGSRDGKPASSGNDNSASIWGKLRLLLWKNLRIQMAHKVETLMEIILPILFTAILVLVRTLIESKEVTTPTIFPSFDVNVLPNTPSLCCNELYFSPDNNATRTLMRIVQQKFFNVSGVSYKIRGFETERDVEIAFAKSSSGDSNTGNASSSDDSSSFLSMMGDDEQSTTVLAGVVFTNDFPQDGYSFPNDIQYKLRFPAAPRGEFDFFEDRFGIKKIWLTEGLYPVVQLFGPRAPQQITGGIPGYFAEGFLYLQQAIDRTLAHLLLPPSSLSKNILDDTEYSIKLERFPYPPYVDDKFLFTLQGVLPIVLILSFIFAVVNIIKSLILEKERRLKEYMRMMGLSNSLHWTAWFIKFFTLLLISNAIITLLLKVRIAEGQLLSALPNTDPSIIFVVLVSHAFQLVAFGFFISTLFRSANIGAIVGAIIWFLIFIPFAFLQPRYNVLSRGVKMLWSVGTNIGICWSCQLFCRLEGTGMGAQWNTFFRGATPDDTFCLADCVLVMILNGMVFLALSGYVEAVWPGEYGIPQPWYFFLTKWYWTGSMRDASGGDWKSTEASMSASSRAKRRDYFETVATSAQPGIQIKGLTKSFGEGKVAVKNLCLDLYENEIFVLLGHNAAGKTTTMSLLAGIFPPTEGTAVLNGYDIRTDMEGVRRSLGLCPQVNVLFPELTVEEHLTFFCSLKGLSQPEDEVNRMLKAIDLEDKRSIQASALSGGMKRRLSVGIAFCAGSKVVLLDEPSSGLDPGARRAIWNLIQGEKNGRTVLLSTHYMDEADILADRIAIMAQGEVQCCGSGLFLKKKYGCGYHLVIVKEPTCDLQKITDILKSRLDDVEEEQNIGAELTYSLPETGAPSFPPVFEELERRKTELGIASYGASITTMEEIFMRVGSMVDKSDFEMIEMKAKDKKNETAVTMNGDSGESRRNEGFTLRFQQFRAMVEKKLIFTRRKWGLLAGKVAIPSVYLTMLLLVLLTIPGFHDPPEHPILLEDYELFGKAFTGVSCNETDPVCAGYLKYLQRNDKVGLRVPSNENLTTFLLAKGEEDQPLVNAKYIVGFEETPTPNKSSSVDLIGFFNNQPMHTPPLALNFISNALLASSSNYSVSVTNHPFEYGIADIEDLGTYFTIGFQVGMHLALAMGFMMGVYTVFPVKERAIGSKHLQLVSGAHISLFWASTFLVDLLAFALPSAAVHAILAAFGIEEFASLPVKAYVLLLLYGFAWAVLPLGYLISLVSNVPSGGLIGLGIFNVFTGFATIFVVNILENPELEKAELASTLHRIFLVFPTYAFGKGVTQIAVNHQLNKACSSIALEFFCPAFPDTKCCTQLREDFLDWEEIGIGKNILSLGIFGIACWIVLLLTESGILHVLHSRCRKTIEQRRTNVENNNSGEDPDVHRERERIQRNETEGDNLIIRNLSKVYSNGCVAVDRISLGVKKGECFGLLGANGAGKTSTFKMLTGELDVTRGNAHIGGFCVRTELKKVHRSVGYCPQFDALLDEMTGRETLALYCRLRGIPEEEISSVTTTLAEELLFTQFLDKIVGSYSGGNKRKLSTAVALLGNPPLVFLDEPTCGIDPVARRHLWECITRIRDRGTSVILTSHSMEETEFLCTRLAIMVNGKLRCLGSPQQLKSKFGEGYTLTCQITKDTPSAQSEEVVDKGTWRRMRGRKVSNVSTVSRASSISRSLKLTPSLSDKLLELRQFIEASTPGCVLEDQHGGFLHYRVAGESSSWAQIFTTMEAAKEKFPIEAYSVGQTSLEQVFLNFTKAQIGADD